MQETHFWDKFFVHSKKVKYRKLLSVLILFLGIQHSSKLLAQDASFKEKETKWQTRNLPYYDDRRLHYGFTLGLNSTRFIPQFSKSYLNPTTNDSLIGLTGTRTTGFTLGFILNLKMTDFLDLRLLPTVAFYQRDVNFTYKSGFLNTQSNESTFIEIPLLCKYKSQRRGNFRMYMVGGIKAAIEAGAKKREKKDTELRANNIDFGIDYGFGVDIYYPLFKFSPELRFTHGLLNMLIQDNNGFSQNLSRLSTHTVTLFLHFE